MSAYKLKQDLYRVLDAVLSEGNPIEIERKGRILKIVPDESTSKLKRLEPHDAIVGEPESIIDLDWSGEWQEEADL